MSADVAVGLHPGYASARRWPRFNLDVPIRVVASMPGKTTIVSGRGRDISEGGMMIFAGIELRLDDIVEVEFTPPFGDPLRVAASVRNRTGYYYGLEFLRDTEQDLKMASRLGDILRSASGLG